MGERPSNLLPSKAKEVRQSALGVFYEPQQPLAHTRIEDAYSNKLV